MARRSRIRDIRIGRHNVAQTRVELTEIGPADRFRIGRPRLQAAAELDAGAGIGKDVDIRRLRTNRSNHPANYTSAFDLPVGQRRPDRSEEHTSELQSLMRISYAVFCLNQKQQPIYALPHHHRTTRQTRNPTVDLTLY